ncbi:MAG: glutamate synthase subunit alpha, partial [Kiritimatiellae bacterium]|nr:glutamate synthase subunit alpha [Kiritimatiellia bacterium]
MDRQQGLYRSEHEHDACGVGLVANLNGEASHEIVESGMTILRRLMHRGATGNDPETGDGAGLLMRIPRGFFRKAVPGLPERFGVAMVFGGVAETEAIDGAVRAEGCRVVAWRDVPHEPAAVGRDARSVMPAIRQLFIAPGDDAADEASFERRLYIVRRRIEKAAPSAYVCSCSSRTVVYKGLLLATQIGKFYPDLSNPGFVSPFAIVHQRYSTNTFPSWELAHPFRAIAHNGEINAIRGNLKALAAREATLESGTFGDELRKLLPVAHGGQSDSASLDNVFELLVAAGRDAPHAMMMLVPQAWGAKYHMGHDIRAFFEYHSALMEPWDGPAAVAFTDGVGLGAALDRNGLRPARWTLASDGLFVLASEAGVLDIPAERVVRHGRLKPGSILWLDIAKHRLLEDAELKTFYARRKPYRRWIAENHILVNGLFTETAPSQVGAAALAREECRFGWSAEDVELILRPMAETGQEPVGAMGNDAALACLRKPGDRSFRLFDCFHQLFAQVTNPPIDPIREELVMSIMTYIGNKGNILAETPEHARLVKMTRPVLTDDELKRLRNIPDFPARTLPLGFAGGLRDALEKLAADALAAAKGGAKIVVLSDRDAGDGAAASALRRIPSLLAVAAVNKALSGAGLRPSVGIVVESGEVVEVHHFAVLLGFGATAIAPWLALAAVARLGEGDAVRATANYVSAVCHGIMKVMSKMGISTLRSYRSAAIFEAVGLGPELMRDYFSGVVSPVGGLELEDIDRRLAPAPAPAAADVPQTAAAAPDGSGLG